MSLTFVGPASGAPVRDAGPALTVSPKVARRLDAALAKLAGHGDAQTRGMSIAIAERDRVVYARGFGEATAGTRFRIASITKMFTAVAIMQLAQAHRIDLDAPIARYLPDAPYANQITVRELLQHRSGLWNYLDAAFADGSVRNPTTPDHILALVAKHPLTAKPGTRYAYSNSGFVVLGLIVERVSAQPLATYEREHILRVAGMTKTAFGDLAGAPVITGYLHARGPAAAGFDSSWLFADGDITSTASDLARFDIALLDGKLVAASTFARMQASSTPTDESAVRQGLGIEIARESGLQFAGHSGGVPGFASANESIPRDDRAIVVLSNSFDFSTAAANNAILTTLYPQFRPPAEPKPNVGVENRSVTGRFRAALTGLLTGDVDRSQYTASTSALLTPELIAQMATTFAPLGQIVRTSYVDERALDNGIAYRYAVTFSRGTTNTWMITIARDGKIAALNADRG